MQALNIACRNTEQNSILFTKKPVVHISAADFLLSKLKLETLKLIQTDRFRNGLDLHACLSS